VDFWVFLAGFFAVLMSDVESSNRRRRRQRKC